MDKHTKAIKDMQAGAALFIRGKIAVYEVIFNDTMSNELAEALKKCEGYAKAAERGLITGQEAIECCFRVLEF